MTKQLFLIKEQVFYPFNNKWEYNPRDTAAALYNACGYMTRFIKIHKVSGFSGNQ